MKDKFFGTPDFRFRPLKKLTIMANGIRYGIGHEISFVYEVVLSVIVLFFSFYFLRWVDVMILIICTGQVLAAELFNTAIEAMCDFQESRENQKIGIIKDLSATAVGISVAVWATAIIYECLRLAVRWLQ